MTTTFANLKIAAETATDPVVMYRAVAEANEKYVRNENTATMVSMIHGRADEAAHLFDVVLPRHKLVLDEINAIWTRAMTGKSAEEIVAIMGAR